MSNNIAEAFDNISKKLGDTGDSNNIVEAIDKFSKSLISRFSRAEENLTYAQIVNDIQAGDATKYSIGDLITSTYHDTVNNVNYDNPWRVVSETITGELEDGNSVNVLPLQSKYGQLRQIQFTSFRALIACPDGLEAGTYNIKFGYKHNNYYSSGSFISFTLANDVPEGGRISRNSYFLPNDASSIPLYVYDSDGKTLLEKVTATNTEAGTNLGTVYSNARSENINCMYEALYGRNNWAGSAIRQYLNSDAGIGEWWKPVDGWDIAPFALSTCPGYLAELPSGFVESLRPIKMVTHGNTNIDASADFTTYDRVILPSLDQMYITPQLTGEGATLDYWKELNGTDTKYQQGSYNASTGLGPIYDEFKIGSIDATSTLCSLWLRSANRSYPNGVWYLYSGGIVDGSSACSSLRFQPIVYVG